MEDESPNPAVKPPPWRWLKARRMARTAAIGFFLACLASTVLLYLVLAFFRKSFLLNVIGALHIGMFIGFLGSLAIWLLVIAFGFFKFRFSLRSLLITTLGLGACGACFSGALGVVGYVVGFLIAVLMVLFGLFWIASFDPPELKASSTPPRTSSSLNLPSIVIEHDTPDK